jgi:hypothetical protein
MYITAFIFDRHERVNELQQHFLPFSPPAPGQLAVHAARSRQLADTDRTVAQGAGAEERRQRAEERRGRAEERRRRAEERRGRAEERRRKAEELRRRAEKLRRKAEELRRRAEERRLRAEGRRRRAEEWRQETCPQVEACDQVT